MTAQEGPIRRSLLDHIRWLERRVAAVDRDLDDTIARSPVWRAKEDLLCSVPGVRKLLTILNAMRTKTTWQHATEATA